MTARQIHIFRIAFLLYIALVMYLCFGHFSQSSPIQPQLLGIPTDKIAHFLMFLPFPVLAFFAFDKYSENFWSSAGYSFLTFLAGALLAAGTELGQAFLTDYRSGDPADFRADLIGLAAGTLAIFILDFRKQRRHEKNA